MKILVVAKFPPIQGGVSASTFWTCMAFTELGHSVQVVTNAREVEATFRENLSPEDESWLDTPGLAIRQTSPLQLYSYLPWAEPFFSKLLGSCLEVISDDRPDFIYGSYFEPYGLVAAVAGKLTNLPVFIRHAGSDLGRLSYHPDLRPSYNWMLDNSALVSPFSSEVEKTFARTPSSSVHMPRPGLPDVFRDPGTRVDVADELERAEAWYSSAVDDLALCRWLVSQRDREFDPGILTIGAYGKVADAKGSFDLLDACERLAEEGRGFNLLCMSCGPRDLLARFYQRVKRSAALAARTWLMPPITPWRVPSFLATCDVVTFLERGFSVPFHTPLVPREVLAARRCLISSGEIAGKRDNERSWVHRENVFVVEDPRFGESLTKGLREVIVNEDLRECIAAQGQYLSKFWEGSLPSYRESAKMLIAEISKAI